MDTNELFALRGPEAIVLLAWLVAVVVAIAAWLRSGKPLTIAGAQEIATDTAALANELNTVAQVAVASAQQLKETGKINSNDEAFQHAVSHIESWYNQFAPDVELDPEVVANAVEAAYHWLKVARSALPSKPPSEADSVNLFLRSGGTSELPPGTR